MYYQEQLLHCAAEGGLSNLVQMLISQDIDINAVDEVRLIVVEYIYILALTIHIY